MRRHRHTGELAFYRCYSPEIVPRRKMVGVVGRRWTIEEPFQAGKGLPGLTNTRFGAEPHWQRWTLLAMLAHALLAAGEHTEQPAADGLIALTCNEIRRLFAIFVIEPARHRACPQARSRW
ncbi:hypothetical protein [Amycolatopsis sp. H20-H5]|uniref:hypothetical protein n=1 Tax=Amycolatopsis sp. H20-H5 TaxID=3046309 RepID=UPI002DBEA5D7|nr:hypothetical protein [Amycolatopsis sp. H20-H5]MEC3976992.1 hypothetical protein [Amycolatopsis sp. H20-H5]